MLITVRCLYCGKEIGAGEYCSEECRKLTQDFQDSVDRNVKWFVLCLIVSFMLILIPLSTGNSLHAVFMFMAMGLTLLVFPYVTPETNDWRGVRTGKLIGRSLGAAIALIALAVLLVFS